MKATFSPIKPWHRLAINKKDYLTAKPWRKTEMSREKFEAIIMALPQEAIDEARISVETESLVEALFGKETIGEQDLA